MVDLGLNSGSALILFSGAEKLLCLNSSIAKVFKHFELSLALLLAMLNSWCYTCLLKTTSHGSAQLVSLPRVVTGKAKSSLRLLVHQSGFIERFRSRERLKVTTQAKIKECS